MFWRQPTGSAVFLGNYLSQLSRSNLKICQAFAVKIDDIDALYRNGTSREFVGAIAAAAQAIAEVVDRTQLLMAYAGDGTILGIVTEERPRSGTSLRTGFSPLWTTWTCVTTMGVR